MSIKYYYLHVGLQAKDTFFGDLKQLYPCSSNLMDPFPVRVLLEVERRYGKKLALEHVDKLSILLAYFTSEPPLSLHPMRKWKQRIRVAFSHMDFEIGMGGQYGRVGFKRNISFSRETMLR
ncbi:hypothetical protein EDD18DRAFT_1111999 [Armillaria luteobubalina]|uniref:Uncharacterized protein n=1 Tax=Armillaria luteobubalina TaxID=153913 RepID=A0AA39PHI3_9AGAR|nr:hypothetical protein EDD18DRAFT_1111999 [Armillaria luteobubalina]